jgi:DNA-binding winged helix-turn-helix (wHTH) protein
MSGQPFKILAILLEQSGEVVTREELQKKLWPDDTFVDFEHSLNSAIKILMTVLGDSAENPRYIETLPRLGYRFIAPVERSDLPATADRPPAPAPPAPSATEELRAAQQIESVSAFDGSPTFARPICSAGWRGGSSRAGIGGPRDRPCQEARCKTRPLDSARPRFWSATDCDSGGRVRDRDLPQESGVAL